MGDRTVSLETAKKWIGQTIGNPAAQDEAASLLEQATANARHATLLVAPELTKNHRSYLARWTGREFIVVELSSAQQAGLGVVPKGLMRDLHGPARDCELQGKSWMTLRDVQITSGDYLDKRQSLTGTCRYEFDGDQASPIPRVALRVQYFHPRFIRDLTCFSHLERPLTPPSGELRFSFPPFVAEAAQDVEQGWLVLYFQLLTAARWQTMSEVQPISNITARLMELR
jgi:hypothetical protein